MCRFNPSNFHIHNAASRSPDDLRQQLIALADRATSIVNAAEHECRSLTESETREVDTAHREFETVQAELRALESASAMTSALSATAGRVSVPDDVYRQRESDARAGRLPGPAAARAGIVLPEDCARPSQLLFAQAASPWRDEEDFFRQVANRLYTPTLLQNATGVSYDGESGGFVTPPSWFSGLIDQSLQAAELAPRCRIFTAQSNSLTFPMPDYQDRQTDLAGLTGNWTSENQTQSAQRLKWRQVNCPLHKVFLLAEASSELAEDGLKYGQQLQQALSVAAGYSLDAAILGGSGAGQPLGIINDSASIAVNPQSGQTADTVIYENLVNIFSRVAPACQKRAVWIISPGVLPSLLQMCFPGSATPVLLGNGNAANAAAGAPVGTIFGRPVIITEIARAIGEAGDVIFADLSQYALVLRNTARIEMNAGPGFNRDVLQWRFILRAGGQSLWNSAVTPYSGGLSLSYAAYLAAR